MTVATPTRTTAVLILAALAVTDCKSVAEPPFNRATGPMKNDILIPPEVRCEATHTKDGLPIVRLQVRNVGTTTIHILADRGMPYQIASDASTLVVFQGLNEPQPSGAIYEMVGVPPTRPLAPGTGLVWDVPVGESMLQDHYLRRPAPVNLVHGMIHVRCEVGWGATPTRPGQMSMNDVFAWQRIESYGPIDVVLP